MYNVIRKREGKPDKPERSLDMKQYKLDVIAEMERMAEDLTEVSLREAALNAGINHLKRQECCEILNVFCKRHPEYHPILMMV